MSTAGTTCKSGHRTKSGRKIQRLEEENEKLAEKNKKLVEENAKLKHKMSTGRTGSEEDKASTADEGERCSINGDDNDDDDEEEEEYTSIGGITGIDGRRIGDHRQELVGHDDGSEKEENEERARKVAQESGNDEEDNEEDEDVFQPNSDLYARLPDNVKAAESNSVIPCLAILGVEQSSDVYKSHYKENTGCQWGSLLREIYGDTHAVGMRSEGPYPQDLYVGVWQRKGSDKPGRRHHCALIWCDEDERIQSFDPHYNNYYGAEPKIIERSSHRALDKVEFLVGVYPEGTTMIHEAEADSGPIELLDSDDSDLD